MKKRIFCNLLVLVLLLGMLPVTALAGGGSQVIWSDDFSDSESWAGWTPIDANGDGFGFEYMTDLIIDEGGGCAGIEDFAVSSRELGDGNAWGTSSDDYLVSPVIDLSQEFEEFELTFDAKMVQAEDGPSYTRTDFYVIDAGYPLTVEGMKAMPYLRFDQVMPYPDEGWKSYRYDLTAYAGRKICLVFHHVDESANRIQLKSFQLTEYERDSHVERICVTNVPEPEAGLSVSDMSESDIVIHDSDNLALVPGSLEFYRTVHEHDELMTGEFEDGGEYDVVFQLQVKDGAFTYTDAIGSVNGRKAFVTLDDKGTPEDSSDDIITVDYYYGILNAPKQTVDRLGISITPPVGGQMPDMHPLLNRDSVEMTYTFWTQMKAENIEGWDLYPGETFSAGTLYRCTMSLQPAAGYCFADSLDCTINGTPHSIDVSDPNGEIKIYVMFTAVEQTDCTVKFCTEYGDTPAPITGRIGAWMQLPYLTDQPNAKFVGWGFQVDAVESDAMSGSLPFTESRTLYAIWLDSIPAPAVGICTYGPETDVFHTSVIIDPYADFTPVEQVQYEPVLWWTKKDAVGKISQRFRGQFEPEQTYYGRLLLEPDGDHYFAEDAAQTLAFSGAELDHAVLEGRRMRLDFHLDVPGDKHLQSARICVPTRIPGYPVDGASNINMYSVTPGVNAEPSTGLWEQKEDVGDYTKAYVGGQKPGETYYGEFILRPTGSVIISKDIQLTIDGASEVSRYTRDDAPGIVFVIYSLEIMDTYGFTAVRRSTDDTYPCGYFCADFEPRWSTLFDFAFVPGGEHWIKAMAEPGYAFLEWRTDDGTDQLISRDNPYTFTLDNNDWDIKAVFAPAHTVSFLNSQGDSPAAQTVIDGGCATEPTGLSAKDFTFKGWFKDPACTEKYDFSEPVTGDLILYSGWDYTPGAGVDKTALEQAISAAEAIDTSKYTVESVTALGMVITGARMVLSAPGATQADVKAAMDNIAAAVAGLEPKDDAFFFDDVKDPGKFYFKPVYWAYEHTPQITKGIDDTHFGPDKDCTRGQVVTFLWRAAGCPAPVVTTSTSKFTDVKPGAFYELAVAWAVEKGITKGETDTTFAPDATCTRGQIVTFLWRFKGEPAPVSTTTQFTDVNPGGYYMNAVAWAVEKEITKGLTKTTFGPEATCSRGQVVTFLYRATQD